MGDPVTYRKDLLVHQDVIVWQGYPAWTKNPCNYSNSYSNNNSYNISCKIWMWSKITVVIIQHRTHLIKLNKITPLQTITIVVINFADDD